VKRNNAAAGQVWGRNKPRCNTPRPEQRPGWGAARPEQRERGDPCGEARGGLIGSCPLGLVCREALVVEWALPPVI